MLQLILPPSPFLQLEYAKLTPTAGSSHWLFRVPGELYPKYPPGSLPHILQAPFHLLPHCESFPGHPV